MIIIQGIFKYDSVSLSLLDKSAWILRVLFDALSLMIKHWIEITSVLGMHAYMFVDCIATC